MRVCGFFHSDNHNHYLDDVNHDVEVFQSIAAAGTALANRYWAAGSHQQPATWTSGETTRDFYPCVEQSANVALWRTQDGITQGPPDWIITLGPKMGIRIEKVG